MDARTDYPWLTAFASRPSGGDPVLIERRREATAALDEIDRLRAGPSAVWLVEEESAPCEPPNFMGVFSTEERANAWVARQRMPSGFYIEAVEVDALWSKFMPVGDDTNQETSS